MLLGTTSVQQPLVWGGWELRTPVTPGKLRRGGLIAAMALIVAAIAGLSAWDAARESAAALQDFADEQATLAGALGAALKVKLGARGTIDERDVVAGLSSVERAGSLALFLRRPGEAVLRGTGGRVVSSPLVIRALVDGRPAVRIPRDEAPDFGLRRRTALAGLSRVEVGPGASWDIVVVASAQRERDRGAWARRRLVLSVLAASGLVLCFGLWDRGRQRKEMLLERELAIADLQRTRDERLQRASRAAALGTLAMGVAHEISTPLGVISARAEQMAARAGSDPRLSEGVAVILSETDRIDQVIRGLLGLARGDAPSAERIDLRAMIASASGLVEHRFASSGVSLAQQVEGDLPNILGDPRLLEHAVVNLLLNACDACRPAGDVVIRAAERERGIEIVVDDTGTGISPADAGRAMEPFFTTKAREGGTGLGLAIAREIVASHRGTLVFSPREPRGTRVSIRLPRAEAHANG